MTGAAEGSEDAAAAALAIVERSMRNNERYMQSLKVTVKEQLASPPANLRFAVDEDRERREAPAARAGSAKPTEARESSPRKHPSPGKQRHGTSATTQAPAHAGGTEVSRDTAAAAADAKEGSRPTSALARRDRAPAGQILDGRATRRPRPSSSGPSVSSATARRYDSVQPDALSIRARR
jgi:hypothetical protein